MPSFYALSWAQLFCHAIKQIDRTVRIIVGGRWVTGPDPHWLRSKLPEADEIIEGLGEPVLSSLINTGNAVHMQYSGMLDSGLNHCLVENFHRYQPSIETSRGCGKGCAFCEERSIKLSPLRPAARLAELMGQVAHDYDSQDIHPYFQSSFFLPNPRWADELRQEVEQRRLRVKWRCETRVDGMQSQTVASLAAAGMKVIDLGMESASPRQIAAMGKARNPERYLEAASELLAACAKNNVWVKLNILLYAGETAQTLDETRAWLDAHSSLIKGVSVGPVVAYGPPKHVNPFLQQVEELGALPIDRLSAERDGITHLHLSSEMSATDAEAESLTLSRRYMSKSDYFDLKSFSYYARDYTRADFEADTECSDRASLPFNL